MACGGSLPPVALGVAFLSLRDMPKPIRSSCEGVDGLHKSGTVGGASTCFFRAMKSLYGRIHDGIVMSMTRM